LLEEAFLCNPQESDLGIANQSCRMASVLRRPGRVSGKGSSGAPVLDRTTFCVLWGGKTCRLGNTLSFKLLERLAHRPNQLVHCEVLLQDVWEGCRSREAVRSVVKMLRQKLNAAKMEGLAGAIDGSTAHHYGLMLGRRY
jgi:DNA-binding response OmpR family regulator